MKYILILLFFISILLYIFVPHKYDLNYNILIGIIYTLSILCYFNIKKKDNYFDFDTLFLTSFTITFFIYPIFLYPIDPEFVVMLTFDFNHDVITESTALSNIGAISYMIGNLTYKEKIEIKQNTISNYSLKSYTLLSVFSFALFIITGGYAWYANGYKGMNEGDGDGAFSSFLILTKVFILIACVVMFYRYNTYKLIHLNIKYLYKPLALFIFFYVLIMFSTGARGAALNIILVLGWLYSYYIKNIKLITFVIGVLGGALILALIGVFRAGGNTEGMTFIDIFMDLIICIRKNFEAIDYVDNNGYSFGKSMLYSMLRIIPFLSGIIHSVFNLSVWETSSSLLITSLTLGEDSSLGLGTSIIADIYLAFGSIGVFFFMYGLGKFIHYLEFKIKSNNVYCMIIYANMIAFSIFLNRGEFFSPVGQISTCIILFYLINYFVMKLPKTNEQT